MDEGWAVMLPFEFQNSEAEGYNPIKNTVRTYNYYAGNELEVPPIIPTVNLNGKTYYNCYRIATYTRPALAYEYLKDMLGKDKFKSILSEYIDRWKYKHPIPYDFFFTFNELAGENLDWYWKPWFYEYALPDLAINKVTQLQKRKIIEIENIGGLPVPIELKITLVNDEIINIRKEASIWKDSKTVLITINSDF